jgi:hypothetical protein
MRLLHSRRRPRRLRDQHYHLPGSQQHVFARWLYPDPSKQWQGCYDFHFDDVGRGNFRRQYGDEFQGVGLDVVDK